MQHETTCKLALISTRW